MFEDNILSITFGGLSIDVTTEVLPNGEINIIPHQIKQYIMESFKSIDFTIRLDRYKRNWWKLYDYANIAMTKLKEIDSTNPKALDTLNELFIEYIDIDYYDNIGNPVLLQSIRCYNAIITSFSNLKIKPNNTETTFEMSISYEAMRFNKDKVKLYNDIKYNLIK